MPRLQHAVTENVTRHVADTHHGEILFLGIQSELAKVPLHRLPHATRGDRHLLVVVTHRAARGEGVPQPETIFLRHGIGVVGETRRALVGGYHQVGIAFVPAHHIPGRYRFTGRQVIGDVEQTAQENVVARDAFLQEGVTLSRGRRVFHHKTALRSDRHDDRVLDHLGFHQTENFGTEILHPVGPAQSAARHFAAAQMDALDARRIDKYLE